MRKAKTNYYWFPVDVKIPEEDGSFSTISGELKVQRYTDDEYNNLVKDTVTNIEACRKAIVEWRDMKDVDGSIVPWSHEELEDAISNSMIAEAFVRAWVSSRYRVLEKNS